MTLNVYDKDLELIVIIDEYNEIVWTNCYDKVGNFILNCVGSKNNLKLLKIGNILSKPKTKEAMVINSFEEVYTPETGLSLKIEGKSLSNILSYRINMYTLNYKSKSIEDILFDIIDKNMINTSDNRKITNINLVKSDYDLPIMQNYQNSYGDILEVVTSLCNTYDIGFRMDFNAYDKTFDFNFYKGKILNGDDGLVLFGEDYDNLKNSEYFESDLQYKNTALIGGQGEGTERQFVLIDDGYNALDRKEIFIDARDIANTENEIMIGKDEYRKLLIQRGKERLNEFQLVENLNSDIDLNSKNFVYKRDYNLGDVVLIKNNRGLIEKRIYEVTEVYNNQTQINISFGNDFNFNA